MKRVVVLLIIVASACGGAAAPSTSTTTAAVDPVGGQTSIEDAALSVVDAVVAVHGEEGGFAAVVWASERGYSGEQLIAAALEGRLEADGMIADAEGVMEVPAGSPLGLIELPEAEVQSMGAMAIRAGNRTSSVMPARLHQIPIDELDRLEAAERDMLTDIMFAIFGGYTLEQIILNILEGGVFDMLRVEINSMGDVATCPILVDSTGQTIVPEEDEYGRELIDSPFSSMWGESVPCHSDIRRRSDADKSEREQAAQEEAGASTSASTVPPPPFPWIYEGTVTQHIAAHTDFGAQGVVEYDNSFPVTVTLNADGTVSGTVSGGSLTTTLVRCTGTASNPGGEVSEGQRDIESWQLTGTHDDGTVTFDRLNVWLASGSDVDGTYTPQEIDAYWEFNWSGELCNAVGSLHTSLTGSFTLVRTEPPAP